MNIHAKTGFTIIEVLVVIAIIGIMTALSAAAFKNMNTSASVKIGTQEVYTALIDSRNKTLGSDDDTVYGVHFETDSVTRFTGATYSFGAPTNEVYTFENGVNASSSLIQNGTNDIIFKRLTGAPGVSGTIFIRNNLNEGTSTILIHGTGLIEN